MYHKIILVGNLGRDPELRYTPSGTPVTNLSVATNRRYTDSNDNPVEQTIWFRVAVWGKQAENCALYLKKGRQVLIEGRLVPDDNGNPRVWTRQDGSPGASFEVSANAVKFLGSGNGASSEPEAEAEALDEEIPF